MRVVAIVQARMSSTRLPGKVLLDIGGETMLARVVRRVRRAASVQQTIVAATHSVADEPIMHECERLGVVVFRGAEEDVLDRFYQAACAYGAEVVVRITSDCPLIDPDVIDQVVGAFQDASLDYASNVIRRTFPRGLDTEVVAFHALECAWREAARPHERVHVTPYLYQHPERFRLLSVTRWDLPSAVHSARACGEQSESSSAPSARADASQYRWTVDTAEDLSFVREVYRRLGNDESFRWTDVLDLMEEDPALSELNRSVQQKALHEG
jgi:spore coat polysaccharide biosynthesis protein SpsF